MYVQTDMLINCMFDVFEQADLNGEAWRGRGDAVPRTRPPQRPEPGPAFVPRDAGGRRGRPALLFRLRGRPEELVVVRKQADWFLLVSLSKIHLPQATALTLKQS